MGLISFQFVHYSCEIDPIDDIDERPNNNKKRHNNKRRVELSSDDDYDLDEDEDELLFVKGARRNVGGVGSSTALASHRVMSRLNMEPLHSKTDNQISHSVMNSIKQGEIKAEAPRNRGLTRETRATVDLVLDQRTIQLLEKLMKWNVFSELFGCISTGKEVSF